MLCFALGVSNQCAQRLGVSGVVFIEQHTQGGITLCQQAVAPGFNAVMTHGELASLVFFGFERVLQRRCVHAAKHARDALQLPLVGNAGFDVAGGFHGFAESAVHGQSVQRGPVQRNQIADLVQAGVAEGATLYQPDIPIPNEGCFYPPTLLFGTEPAMHVAQEEIFGPVLVSMTFRTPDEAVMLANNTRYGLAGSVWTENINLALDIAPKIKAGVIWVNATNMFDAAAGFGGYRESGFGREGGWEGLLAYLKPSDAGKPVKPAKLHAPGEADFEGIDRTAKLYVGGKQARPDGGYSRAIHRPRGALIGHVGIANRKDIRNAVEAAQAAAGWGKTTGHLRAQILYYLAENLGARAGEFADRIRAQTGRSAASARDEVDIALSRLFSYAAWADKFDGAVKSVPIRGVALAMNEPVGVIGAFCPEEAPLLGPVSLLAPAMAMGNRVILVAGESAPLSATDLYQVLDTSDVPGGVVNILTGSHADLAKPLATHMDVNAVWSFSSADVSGAIEAGSAGSLKRTWVNNGRNPDWFGAAGEGKAFLRAATEVKTVWVPYGE